MPIMRNPFKRQDENVRPSSAAAANGLAGAQQKKTDATTKPMDIGAAQKEPAEYKLSEINDSGVFVPPSPPERKSFWHTNSSRSTTSSNHRSLVDENEQFNISRESFECYRRSFDISARSPIIQASEQRPRASLDSHALRLPSRRPSGNPPPTSVPPSTREEELEDVNLEEPVASKPQRKKGLFSRLTESSGDNQSATGGSGGSDRPASSGGSGGGLLHFGSRRRGQSTGQGAELGSMTTGKGENTATTVVPQQQQQTPQQQQPPPQQAAQREQVPPSQVQPQQQQQQQQPEEEPHRVNNQQTPQITVSQ